jgi:long-subunit acyl-CoA synthetase (AMP-forming)
MLYRGYVGDSKATAQEFSEGWLRTGDILTIDEKQNFWVTDRLKEVCLFFLPSLPGRFVSNWCAR